ncbi:MAG: hypothetical protein KZQ83_12815 [gamma proteobacterium symbiont of Taylorina sp.]|nr:hypothetical protein [gamma proteobacterium symbiont of Taylorina sp.]
MNLYFKSKSLWLIIITLCILVLITIQNKSIIVDSVQAAYAPMKVTIAEQAKTRVVERFTITAPIDAYMKRLDLLAGDDVKIGQTLIILEPLPSSVLDPSSHAQAEAVLGASQEMENIIREISIAAKADQDLAEISFKRADKLYKNNNLSEHELDITKVDKRRAEAIYRASQFGWIFSKYLTKMSQSVLDYENIRHTELDHRSFKMLSTSNGKILKLFGKSERVVNRGDLLMEIGDIKHLEIEVEVLSSVAIKLKPDMLVELDNWGGNNLLYGQIKVIESSGFTKISALGVEEQRVKVIVSIRSDLISETTMAVNIGDAFRLEARFILWQANKVLQIPNSALFVDQYSGERKKWAVYIIKEGRLEKRSVMIGHKNNLMAEVIEGLSEKDQLVSYLSNDLKEGVKVDIR